MGVKVVQYEVREQRVISCEIEVDQDAHVDAEMITETHERHRDHGHFDDEHSRDLFCTEVLSIKVDGVELLQKAPARTQPGETLFVIREASLDDFDRGGW